MCRIATFTKERPPPYFKPYRTVRFEGFVTFTREKTRTGYVDDLGLVQEYVAVLFQEFEKDRRKIRLVGVRVSDLKPAEGKQVN